MRRNAARSLATRARVAIDNRSPNGMRSTTMFALMLAVFAVSVGYSVVLPFLPSLVEGVVRAGDPESRVSQHTGLVTGVYTLALFLFAPAWGGLSDRYGRRNVLLVGLLGFAMVMAVFSSVQSIAAIYLERFSSGVFAAAVTPVAAATIGDLFSAEEGRGRRLAFVSMAGVAGFLLGPIFGVSVTAWAAAFVTVTNPGASVRVAFVVTALLASLASAAVALTVPNRSKQTRMEDVATIRHDPTTSAMSKLLLLSFIVSTAIGVFEVGLALRGNQELGLTPSQIALMFTECSAIMLLVQAAVFSPWIEASATRWFITPALLVLAAALLLVPRASDFALLLAAIGGVAASAGVLSPVLTYWISASAGRAQGWELGKQTAAASLGAAVGSAAGGLLFNVAGLPGAPFLATAGLTAVGLLVSLGLARALVSNSL